MREQGKDIKEEGVGQAMDSITDSVFNYTA